jgi:polyferredoxin
MLGQWSGIQTLKHQSMAFGLQAMQIVLVSWVTVLFFQTIEFALAVTNFSCLQKYFIDAFIFNKNKLLPNNANFLTKI